MSFFYTYLGLPRICSENIFESSNEAVILKVNKSLLLAKDSLDEKIESYRRLLSTLIPLPIKTDKYGIVGIAQKIIDGNQRANEAAIMLILNHLRLLRPEEKTKFRQVR